MAAARARAGDLAWIEQGEGPDGETGPVAAQPQAWGDVILARKETPTSYHLSVVIDDALQGVTDVVRGQDLFWSTSVHRLLQKAAGSAAAGLPSSPAGARRRWPEAFEVDRGHRLAGTARPRRGPGRHSPPGRLALIRLGFAACGSQAEKRRRVTPPARSWHAAAGPGGRIMARKSRSPRSARTLKKRMLKRRTPAKRAREACHARHAKHGRDRACRLRA